MISVPEDWTTDHLESVMSAIIDYRGKTPKKTESGVPLITAKIIKNGRIETPTEFISAEEYDTWMRRGLPETGDVLITTEAPLGEVAQLASADIALAQRVILLRGQPDVLDNTFLKFALQSREVQHQLTARSSGTTVSGIRQSELRKVLLPLPSLHEQKQIAKILGLLDDKIELDRKMNQTLEAMAQAIFKSWFIDFDDVPEDDLVDSELGPIPAGWEVGTLGDVAERFLDSASPEDLEPDTPYIGLGDMPEGAITLDTWGRASDSSSTKAIFDAGDILFGKLRPYFKKVGIAPAAGICSTDIYVVRPKSPAWYAYVLGLLTYDPFIAFTEAVSTGTRMPRVNWKSMSGYEIAVPPKALAQRYNDVVSPLLDRIVANVWESRTLAELRDTLLPKLISGEIRVPEAAEQLEMGL